MGHKKFSVASNPDIAKRAGVAFILFKIDEDGRGNVDSPIKPIIKSNDVPKVAEGLMVRWDATGGHAVEHFRLFEAMPPAVFNANGAATDQEKMILRINKMVEWMRQDANIDG